LTIVIPLTIAFFMGSVTAPLALSIPLLSTMTTLNSVSVGLIFQFSLLGYLISPLHLCLIVTREYFETRLIDVYRLLLPPSAAAMIIGPLFALPFI
jgi:hypothetical protein